MSWSKGEIRVFCHWHLPLQPYVHFEPQRHLTFLGLGQDHKWKPLANVPLSPPPLMHTAGLCTYSGQYIQAHPPNICLLLPFRLRYVTSVSCLPSRGGIGEGPMEALEVGWGANGAVKFEDLKCLELGLEAGRGCGWQVGMSPWSWGLIAPLGGERWKRAGVRSSKAGEAPLSPSVGGTVSRPGIWE